MFSRIEEKNTAFLSGFSMPTLSSSSGSGDQSHLFRNKPQKFPRAQAKAAQVVTNIHELMKKTPRTLVATVVDTSFHASMGYVLATTELGIVRVYGVPVGSVVAQMRIYVRQLGPHSTNRTYIFDGQAPALSIMGFSSGSLSYTTTVGDSGSVLASTAAGGLPTISTLTSAVGYYWSLFFYIPTLPTSPRVTLFTMRNSGNTNGFSIEYLSSGLLVVRDPIGGHGYITTQPVAPHEIHWLVCQPGTGTGLDLYIDGLSFYTGINSPTDIPVFSAAGATYTGYLLSNQDGSGTPPLGTWISKLGYGASYSGSAVIPLSVTTTIPGQDSDIPTLTGGTTVKTIGLYLCEDTPGGTTLANSAASGGGGPFTVTSSATVQAIGPY